MQKIYPASSAHDIKYQSPPVDHYDAQCLEIGKLLRARWWLGGLVIVLFVLVVSLAGKDIILQERIIALEKLSTTENGSLQLPVK